MNRSTKRRLARLIAIPAGALAMLGWASVAHAHGAHGYSYSPHDRDGSGYLDVRDRHERRLRAPFHVHAYCHDDRHRAGHHRAGHHRAGHYHAGPDGHGYYRDGHYRDVQRARPCYRAGARYRVGVDARWRVAW
jgi:hypothetical protein